MIFPIVLLARFRAVGYASASSADTQRFVWFWGEKEGEIRCETTLPHNHKPRRVTTPRMPDGRARIVPYLDKRSHQENEAMGKEVLLTWFTVAMGADIWFGQVWRLTHLTN